MWAVVPPNDLDATEVDPDYPSWGTTAERIEVTRLFNCMLAEKLEPAGVGVVSIFDELLGEDGRADAHYYMDRVHLSTAALPLAIKAISACRLIPWCR